MAYLISWPISKAVFIQTQRGFMPVRYGRIHLDIQNSRSVKARVAACLSMGFPNSGLCTCESEGSAHTTHRHTRSRAGGFEAAEGALSLDSMVVLEAIRFW
jgi:hypothetical protein